MGGDLSVECSWEELSSGKQGRLLTPRFHLGRQTWSVFPSFLVCKVRSNHFAEHCGAEMLCKKTTELRSGLPLCHSAGVTSGQGHRAS